MSVNFDFSNTGFTLPIWIILSASLAVSFLISWVSIPTIVKVSSLKKLFDVPNERTSHTTTIPILGGLSIFAGFTLSAIIFSLKPDSGELKFLIGAIIVLFFTGLKDDILIIDPKKKFLSQLLAALILVILGNIRITDFHGAFGIQHISYISSIIFTVFLIVVIINGFNLIDGVDGLAAGIGILTSLFLGIWFLLSGHFTYAILCFSLIGSLIAFFIFNAYGKENKIFMGDTGSLVTGLIISVFTVKFLEFEKSAEIGLQFLATAAMAFGLLIIPLFDTLRVFILRILNGKSPFKADRNHIHHNLLKLGYSHLRVTSILIFLNLFFILFVYLFQELGSVLLIIITTSLAFILSFFLDYRLRKKNL
jgi:UDP-GlcNAc:undecaprenyl-phosphate GlcNAc-1-phosphate transferase